MTDAARRAIACIVGNIVNNTNSSYVYDYFQSSYFSFSFSKAGNNISAFDYGESCYLSGSGNGVTYTLFHYGNGAHITLELNGKNFSGYDYRSGKYFSGTVSNKAISIYDYGQSKYFNYSI